MKAKCCVFCRYAGVCLEGLNMTTRNHRIIDLWNEIRTAGMSTTINFGTNVVTICTAWINNTDITLCHTVYSHLYNPHGKQRLFHYRTLANWCLVEDCFCEGRVEYFLRYSQEVQLSEGKTIAAWFKNASEKQRKSLSLCHTVHSRLYNPHGKQDCFAIEQWPVVVLMEIVSVTEELNIYALFPRRSAFGR